MKNFIVGMCLVLAGCGVSPGDAAEELGAENFQDVCGYDHLDDQEVEKAFIPDMFGITMAYGCSATGSWSGSVCRIPSSREFDIKVVADGQDQTWIDLLKDASDSVVSIANGAGWDITQVSSSFAPFQFRTGTTHPEGVMGDIKTFSVDTIAEPGQGNYLVHHVCLAYIYRTHVEANWAYQAASTAQKKQYIRNLAKHEMYHCLGLAHTQGTSNTLMSQSYTYPGPRYYMDMYPTVAEQQMMEDFVAHY